MTMKRKMRKIAEKRDQEISKLERKIFLDGYNIKALKRYKEELERE